MSVKSLINRTTVHNRFVCRQRQIWTRARRVKWSGGAFTVPRDGSTPGVESSLLISVACYRRTSNRKKRVDTVLNHLLTSLKALRNTPDCTTDKEKERQRENRQEF